MYDIVIVGGGPAGMTAAIYARRAGKSVLVLEALSCGGQILNTPDIENYPVEAHISGFDFSQKVYEQAKGLGAEFKFEKAVALRDEGGEKVVVTNKGEYRARAVILATGSANRKLGVEDEDRLVGRGVSYCATCDGNFYRKKTVAVVGGGDTACEEAQYLAGLCKKVYMIVRRDVLRASEAMQKKVKETENIEILWNTQVRGLYGTEGVEGAHLSTGEDLPIDGLFLAIGHHPNSDVFRPALECDAEGYIIVHHPTTETNIPGVFACGDVADPIYRQAISAAGSGCHAAMDARKYLSEK